MSKRAFRSLTVLCLAIGLLFALAASAKAADLTPDYYISGSLGAYDVGSSADGVQIGSYTTFEDALAACASPDMPVIQLGSSDSPLKVNRGEVI